MITTELQTDATYFVALCETAQFRAAQSVARGQYVASDIIEIKKEGGEGAETTRKRLSKLINSLLMETYIALLINFVNMR